MRTKPIRTMQMTRMTMTTRTVVKYRSGFVSIVSRRDDSGMNLVLMSASDKDAVQRNGLKSAPAATQVL